MIIFTTMTMIIYIIIIVIINTTIIIIKLHILLQMEELSQLLNLACNKRLNLK